MDINIFDPNYVQKQQVLSLQRMAVEQNALRVQAYNGQCADWVAANQRNRGMGLPLSPVPSIPRKITVTEAGDWTEAPFTDLQAPSLPPEVPAQATYSIRPPASAVPADRLDQVIAMIQVLNAKLDALLGRAASN